ncbi:ATP-dependent helicase RRM3 [Glycine soja]|nr:ATP-dependent helicase RRM3 [Glycine soja]
MKVFNFKAVAAYRSFSSKRGKFVFIIGSVGTGKTLLLEEIIKFLNRLYTPSEVYVTASTGVATCAIKGQTLHFFAGIGIFTDDDPQNLVERVLSHQGACRGWRKVEALVIDEINIVSTKLFDSLECVARGVTGVVYAFEAECWNISFDLQVELTNVFRQSDYGLTTLLEGIRRGESDPQDLEFLEYLCLGSNGCVNDLLPEI